MLATSAFALITTLALNLFCSMVTNARLPPPRRLDVSSEGLGFLWGVKSRSLNCNAAGLVLVVAPSRVSFGGGFLLRALPPRAFLVAPRVRVRFRPGRAELDGEGLESAHAGRLAPMVFASQRSGTARNADAAKLPATWGREGREGGSRETGSTWRTSGRLDSRLLSSLVTPTAVGGVSVSPWVGPPRSSFSVPVS